jgi:plasmid stabilization system protein ParE
MTVRYVLAPEAALDLVQIWRYIRKQSSVAIADRVETVIRERIIFLARTPGAGHWSKQLTDEPVKFFPVYSYLSTGPRKRPFKWCPFSTAAGTWNKFSKSVFLRDNCDSVRRGPANSQHIVIPRTRAATA